MPFQSEYVKIGRMRISRRKLKRRVYQMISLLIAFMFLAALIYTILLGKAPT